MAVIYPIYKVFNDLIFSGTKPFEFRTRLPKNLTTGTKVYIYEPVKHCGCRKVVGEFAVGNILHCDYHIGCIPFLPYFCRNVLKDEDYAQKFEKALSIPMPEYKKGFAAQFALDKESIKHIEKTGKPPKPEDYLYNHARCVKLDKVEEIMDMTDCWLRRIGFYNAFDESNYKFALEIINPVRYTTPKDLGEFKKLDGTKIEKAPQSFVYAQDM